MELDKNKIKSSFYFLDIIPISEGSYVPIIRRGELINIIPKINFKDTFNSLEYDRINNYLFEVPGYNGKKRVIVTTNPEMVFETLDEVTSAVLAVQNEALYDYSIIGELK